jgi:antitoxin (DNA-binding transcriptional repressor) of toxin-antitoxin stability system
MTMIIDHGTIGRMKSVAISLFKARCLALLADVQRTGEPLLVTKRGRPLVRVEAAPVRRGPAYGSMKGRIRISGDVLAPVLPPSAWGSGR